MRARTVGETKYTRDEVEAILSRAASGERGEMSHDELVEAAREAGIDPEAVEIAAQEVQEQRQLVVARNRRRDRRRRKFFAHLRSYLLVNAALFGIDFLPDGNIEWAFFPLIGWGIGLAFDAMSRLGPEDPDTAEARDLKELERLRRLDRRRKGKRGVDFRLGPNFQVRVDLPDDDREETVEAGRGRCRGHRHVR